MLSCQDCEKYLGAFLDNALEVGAHLDVQEHLHTCASCATRAEAERALRVFVRQHASVPSLPEHVKRRLIRNAIHSSACLGWAIRVQAAVHLRHAIMGAATAAIALLLVLGPFTGLFTGENILQKFGHEASLAYSTYIIQRMPSEVASTNARDVMRWFKNRMGAHVQSPYMTDEATQLLGGRLDHLLDRKSAALIYQRRGVPVLLFAFISDRLSLPVKRMIRAQGRLFYVQTVSGRPIVTWQQDGITYSMVGDVDRHDLLQMASTVSYR